METCYKPEGDGLVVTDEVTHLSSRPATAEDFSGPAPLDANGDPVLLYVCECKKGGGCKEYRQDWCNKHNATTCTEMLWSNCGKKS